MDPVPDRGASGAATAELLAWTAGDPAAAGRLLPQVYSELRHLAGAVFRGRRADQTLQPTALVHEAFLRLIDPARVAVRDRAHFRALAATAMRQVLTDHARRRLARKRGGDRARATWVELPADAEDRSLDLLVLDEVLARLEALSYRVTVTVVVGAPPRCVQSCGRRKFA